MRRALHAEWTKLRTVRGWVLTLAAAAAATVALGVTTGGSGTCVPERPCTLPVNHDGIEVHDAFTLAGQDLTGDGSITAHLRSFTGRVPVPDGPARAGLAPWAKAGLIVKDGTGQGSTYAAVMLTGAHGVRLQHDYSHDAAGVATASWLRLTRAGATITGEQSADGSAWTRIGAVALPRLPATARVGLFVTSPQVVAAGFSGPSAATAVFDPPVLTGWSGSAWSSAVVGRDPEGAARADGFTLTGSGDIAPAVSGLAGLGVGVGQTLSGIFAGLILVVVLGASFVTSEYRTGLIRTTAGAVPDRMRMLTAKVAVAGTVTFGLGLAVATLLLVYGPDVLNGNGLYVHPATVATQVRMVTGTAALLALATVFALALGVVLRRGVTAVTVAVTAVVLPYLLAMTAVPDEAGRWLLRVTPAAALAVQQSEPRWPQVDNVYTPVNGFFPLPAWAGLAVLAGWTLAALAAAVVLLRRRDV